MDSDRSGDQRRCCFTMPRPSSCREAVDGHDKADGAATSPIRGWRVFSRFFSLLIPDGAGGPKSLAQIQSARLA
jgi:hypothetical protein